MKAICASAGIFGVTGYRDPVEFIELVGRTCYKSENKIKEGSAEGFITGLIKSGHESVLEHANFIFKIDIETHSFLSTMIQDLEESYAFTSFLKFTEGDRCLMSGNVRAFRDFFMAYSLIYCEIPSFFKDFIVKNQVFFPEFHEFIDLGFGKIEEFPVDLLNDVEALVHCAVSVKFIVDRGVSHELVRHRPASFAQESTRYCNYTKGKFGKELTFIIPCFWGYKSKEWKSWIDHMEAVEKEYFHLVDDCCCLPEEARCVLPNCLKTELIMTANLQEWKHFFELRACDKTGKAHPQMKEVSRPLLSEFKLMFNNLFEDLTYEK